MMSTSGLTLYFAIEVASRRLCTRTIADPSFKSLAAPHDGLDLFNNRLDAINALSKALEKEKRIFTKKIALCCLEIKVKDL
jgi:hypothetical protein